jgi:hypothetical protein
MSRTGILGLANNLLAVLMMLKDNILRMGDGLMKKFNVRVSKRKIIEFCKRNHIRSLSLFGSVLRNDFSPSSDIDVLVEFEPDYVPGFFALIEMEEELSSIFSGRKVDLRTPNDLSKYFRDEVLAEAEAVYVES